jgi:long-chain acyl-CoA synthetase
MKNSTDLPWQAIYDELGVIVPTPDDRPLGRYIEQHAIERPDAVALQYFDREISYRELNALANSFANGLLAMGVTRDSVVGIHLPNIPQYAIALVACAKIGCAGSGVSPLMTSNEIAHQLDDAHISVLLSLDTLVANTVSNITEMPECLRHIVVAGAEDLRSPSAQSQFTIAGVVSHHFLAVIAKASGDYSQQSVTAEDTMMVQYTGGTTGPPKGAELTVRSLMYNPEQYSAYTPWETGTEVLATAFPMFHAAGLAFVIAGLRFGARLLLVPDPRDVAHFCHLMQQFPPTRLAAVPSLYQMLLACPEINDVDFSALKVAHSGAAPLSGEDRRQIEAVIGENKMSDLFGMTETGPVHVCNPPMRAKPTSVGIPVPGADTRIVDLETGTQEMPTGEPGEIITSGPQVMKGYLNLPDESTKAMRQWRGETWMYTGDVGYMDEEGYIYLCDRAKDMLIVGGYKVFSVEVEDKLQSLDFIAKSAILGTTDEKRPGNDIVNLYLELVPMARERDAAEIEADVLAFCRANMAPYKIPKIIKIIDQIPLTAVGKIDKKQLRQQANESPT